MNCPVDNELLQMTDRQGVEVDYCPRCRGVWLGRGELDKIIERASLELAASWTAAPATTTGTEGTTTGTGGTTTGTGGTTAGRAAIGGNASARS